MAAPVSAPSRSREGPPGSGAPSSSRPVDVPASGRRNRGRDHRDEHHKRRHKAAKRKKRKKKRTHRAYGLPNANQIFLTMVVVALLFIELLRPNWLIFESSNATAGLSGFRFPGSNDTTTRVSWHAFCDADDYNYTLPLDSTADPPLKQPFSTREVAVRACNTHTPEILRVFTAMSIAFSMLSVTLALYFHLGSPSQRQVALLGLIPGLALLVTAVFGTAGLAIWQEHFGPFDNGDCFSIAISSTVISYVVSISMGIRWRWPGIFAVDNEQQAFEVRRTWRRRPAPPPACSDDTTPRTAESPRPNNNFREFV